MPKHKVGNWALDSDILVDTAIWDANGYEFVQKRVENNAIPAQNKHMQETTTYESCGQTWNEKNFPFSWSQRSARNAQISLEWYSAFGWVELTPPLLGEQQQQVPLPRGLPKSFVIWPREMGECLFAHMGSC